MNSLLSQHWRLYSGDKFHYAAIKTTERQTEETKELSEDSFDPEESKAMKRKMDCKVITYNEHKEDDKCNDNEHNESNENQWLILLMMSSDAEDILVWAVWRRNMRSIGPWISADV